MAIVGWILLAIVCLIVAVLLSLFFLPLGFKIECVNGWRLVVYLYGLIPVFRLSFPFELPTKTEVTETEEPKTDEPKRAVTEKTAEEKQQQPSLLDELRSFFQEEGISGVLNIFKTLYRIFSSTLKSAKRFVTIRKLALNVRVGGEEADDIALNYGRISTAVTVSLAALSKVIRIKRPCVRVVPDFTLTSCDVKMRLVLWLWPFGLAYAGLIMLCKMGILFLKSWWTAKSALKTVGHKVET